MHVCMCMGVWAYLCMYAFMLVCMHLRLQVSGYFMQRLLKTEQRRINATLSICTYFICCPVSVLAALRVLRSAARGEFLVPRARLAIMQRRAFSVVGPSAWNDLPFEL